MYIKDTIIIIIIIITIVIFIIITIIIFILGQGTLFFNGIQNRVRIFSYYFNLHSAAPAECISLKKTREGGRKFNPNFF